jgi:hypothetical protein
MNSHRFALRSFLISVVGTFLGVVLASVPRATYAQVRWEMRPLETMTVTAQQFLTGDKIGKPVVVAGELRISKPGTDKLPTVILVHPSGGVNAGVDRWARAGS